MFKTRTIFSTGIMLGTALAASFASTAQANQNVANLVPKEWQEIVRHVEVRHKMYYTNLYGNEATFQVMFRNGTTPVAFDSQGFSVNSDSVSCEDPSGQDLGTLNSAYTKICTFTPKLILNGVNGTGGYSTEMLPDYWMRIKFDQATSRNIVLRHEQPIAPHCIDDSSADPRAYDRLQSCGTVVSDLSFNNNLIHKPRVSGPNNEDQVMVWAPLAMKDNKYRVTLDIRGGKVQVQNGLKMKVSGAINADPNDEMMEAAKFDGACAFEENVTLPVGVYTCEFTAADDGFMHIPLKRAVTTTSRRVITTIENITGTAQ